MIIGYFADGPWSHLALDKLLTYSDVKIAFICARFDKQDPILKRKAVKSNIPFIVHPNINSNQFMHEIAKYVCDLFVSMSFNQIFGKRMLETPPLGVINCHAGQLPFYRGRNVLNWALINDEKEFGITVHYVDQGIDTGDIILQKCYPITDADDYNTLLERAYKYCADLLVKGVEVIQNGDVKRIKQLEIDPYGFYCTARREGDERLNWNQPSRQVFNFVRAICAPGPAARSFVGNSEVKINRVEYLANAHCYIGIAGAVISKDSDGILIKTANSFVRLVDWEAEKPLKIGDRFT